MLSFSNCCDWADNAFLGTKIHHICNASTLSDIPSRGLARHTGSQKPTHLPPLNLFLQSTCVSLYLCISWRLSGSASKYGCVQFLCMSIYLCFCLCVFVCMCKYVCECVCVCVCMFVCMCVCMRAYVCAGERVYVCVCVSV
jgi:hypothetical protein